MPTFNFNPEKDIPDLSGKVVLITGGTAGLGYESALSLASHNPAHIFFTGRSQPSADKLLNEVNTKYPQTKVTFIPCDQTSLASVKEAARFITSQTTRLDICIANAGIMAQPPGQTKNGYEMQFGTNHVAHALLVKLLLPLLEQTAATAPHDVRIIWLTSLGYQFAPHDGILFPSLSTPQASICTFSSFLGAWYRYGQSKLANLLYARAFAQHHPNILSVAVHPGISATGIVTNLPLAQKMFVYATTVGQKVPPEMCAWNQQWAATCAREGIESGRFYEPVGVFGRMNEAAKDEELAKRLWEWTEKELEGWVWD